MSQRPKGPGRSPTSSTIPSLSLPHPPEPGLSFYPFPRKHEIFLLRGAPLEPVLVSVHLSVIPIRVQPWGMDWAGASATARNLVPPVWPLLVPPCPVSARM